uniref:Ig-like domain-containing protein n=1 Tax=Knipowitschia caucasica TaxID=637954 RepID=A0AAV2JZV3_KNICA
MEEKRKEREEAELSRQQEPAPGPAQGEGLALPTPQGKGLAPLAVPSLQRAKGYKLLEEEKTSPVPLQHLYPLAEVGMEAGRGIPAFPSLEEKGEEGLPMENISKVYDETLPSYAQTTETTGVILHEEEVKSAEAEKGRMEELADEDVEVQTAANDMEASDTIEDTRPLSRMSKASSRASYILKELTNTVEVGAMETSHRFSCLITILSYFWIPSNADINTVAAIIGSQVHLFCQDDSLDTLSQLTWFKNKTPLVTFAPQPRKHWHCQECQLQMNMSTSEADSYALIINTVQRHHGGNYSCQTTTGSGVWEKTWELNIIDTEEEEESPSILIYIISAISVGSIFVVGLTIILFKLCRKSIRPVAAVMPQEIYENCLEGRHSQSHHVYSN